MADLVALEEVRAALNLGADMSHDTELDLYIDAATQHVADRFGTLPSAEYTELVTADTAGRLATLHYPVLSVTSATDEFEPATSHTDGFRVSADGYYITHDDVVFTGAWTVVYTAGFAAIPADLKLAVLEDIRGLYQPGQIGPPAAFGAFGIESTDTGPSYRPVRMWPRVDGWLAKYPRLFR